MSPAVIWNIHTVKISLFYTTKTVEEITTWNYHHYRLLRHFWILLPSKLRSVLKINLFSVEIQRVTGNNAVSPLKLYNQHTRLLTFDLVECQILYSSSTDHYKMGHWVDHRLESQSNLWQISEFHSCWKGETNKWCTKPAPPPENKCLIVFRCTWI